MRLTKQVNTDKPNAKYCHEYHKVIERYNSAIVNKESDLWVWFFRAYQEEKNGNLQADNR